MSAKQYLPISYEHNNKPVILYPAKDDGFLEKAFSRSVKASLESYVNGLIDSDPDYFKNTDLILAYVWNQEQVPYADIWKVNRNNISDDSGLLYDVRVYANKDIITDMGVASGNSLMVIAAEELLLRNLIVNDGLSFIEASDRSNHKPKFPEGYTPEENFYK